MNVCLFKLLGMFTVLKRQALLYHPDLWVSKSHGSIFYIENKYGNLVAVKQPYARVTVAKVCCCSPVKQLKVQSLQEIF